MRKVIEVMLVAVTLLIVGLNYASGQCVILERGRQSMGPFHILSRNYLYVEGATLPDTFHGAPSDKDVQKLIASGVHVQIIDSSFRPTVGWRQKDAVQRDFFQERLDSARNICAAYNRAAAPAAVTRATVPMVNTVIRHAVCVAVDTDKQGNETCARWGVTPDAQ